MKKEYFNILKYIIQYGMNWDDGDSKGPGPAFINAIRKDRSVKTVKRFLFETLDCVVRGFDCKNRQELVQLVKQGKVDKGYFVKQETLRVAYSWMKYGCNLSDSKLKADVKADEQCAKLILQYAKETGQEFNTNEIKSAIVPIDQKATNA